MSTMSFTDRPSWYSLGTYSWTGRVLVLRPLPVRAVRELLRSPVTGSPAGEVLFCAVGIQDCMVLITHVVLDERGFDRAHLAGRLTAAGAVVLRHGTPVRTIESRRPV